TARLGANLDPPRTRRMECGIINRKVRCLVRSGRDNVAVRQCCPDRPYVEEREFMADGTNRVPQPEALRLHDSPRLHEFAADAVLKADFALDHQNARAETGHDVRNRCAAEPSTYSNHVVAGHVTTHTVA